MAEATPEQTAEVLLKAARETPNQMIGFKGSDLLHAFGTEQERAKYGPSDDDGNEGGNAQS